MLSGNRNGVEANVGDLTVTDGGLAATKAWASTPSMALNHGAGATVTRTTMSGNSAGIKARQCGLTVTDCTIGGNGEDGSSAAPKAWPR